MCSNKKNRGRPKTQEQEPEKEPEQEPVEMPEEVDSEPESEDSFASNWIGQYSQEELQKQQSDDEAIKKMIDLKSNGGDKPKWAEFKTLCAQWSKLVVNGGLLYRRWEPEDTSQQALMQLVLPPGLRMDIFKELHSKRIAGHLGVAKTVLLAMF